MKLTVIVGLIFLINTFCLANTDCTIGVSSLVDLGHGISDEVKTEAIKKIEDKGYILRYDHSRYTLKIIHVTAKPVVLRQSGSKSSYRCGYSKQRFEAILEDNTMITHVVINSRLARKGSVVDTSRGIVYKSGSVCSGNEVPKSWQRSRNKSLLRAIAKLKSCKTLTTIDDGHYSSK